MATVLFITHRGVIDNQELAAALLASLSRHENSIEQSRRADSGFLMAMQADTGEQFVVSSSYGLRGKFPQKMTDNRAKQLTERLQGY